MERAVEVVAQLRLHGADISSDHLATTATPSRPLWEGYTSGYSRLPDEAIVGHAVCAGFGSSNETWRCDTTLHELLAALDSFQGKWPDFVYSQQKNWIGRSIGATITFPLEGLKLPKKLDTLDRAPLFPDPQLTLVGGTDRSASPSGSLTVEARPRT
jgi:hypothetical protein